MKQQIIKAYHGSGTEISEFDYQWTGQGNDQNGSGFYFTSDYDEAFGYTGRTLAGLSKLGGSDRPTVHVVELTFNNPLQHDTEKAMTQAQVEAIIRRAPDLNDALMNWGDVDYYGLEKVLKSAIPAYAKPGKFLLQSLNELANDFFGSEIKAFNEAVRDALGYDSVIEKFEGGKVHYVAWFPEQINIIERIAVDRPEPVQRSRHRP